MHHHSSQPRQATVGTERHTFLLRAGAESVEWRGIDGRHLRTQKSETRNWKPRRPQKSSDYFPHEVKTKCITENVQFSSELSGVETLRHCMVSREDMYPVNMLVDSCRQLALERRSRRRIYHAAGGVASHVDKMLVASKEKGR